jgi:hypothetical protein
LTALHPSARLSTIIRVGKIVVSSSLTTQHSCCHILEKLLYFFLIVGSLAIPEKILANAAEYMGI